MKIQQSVLKSSVLYTVDKDCVKISQVFNKLRKRIPPCMIKGSMRKSSLHGYVDRHCNRGFYLMKERVNPKPTQN